MPYNALSHFFDNGPTMYCFTQTAANYVSNDPTITRVALQSLDPQTALNSPDTSHCVTVLACCHYVVITRLQYLKALNSIK